MLRALGGNILGQPKTIVRLMRNYSPGFKQIQNLLFLHSEQERHPSVAVEKHLMFKFFLSLVPHGAKRLTDQGIDIYADLGSSVENMFEDLLVHHGILFR